MNQYSNLSRKIIPFRTTSLSFFKYLKHAVTMLQG